ncbi:putative NH(3)-dependent NAD(+) synthetase [uncultured archaeon]|nr:putative NH(3)-dependent NAD(+) synthetase [uncultured archaeon]
MNGASLFPQKNMAAVSQELATQLKDFMKKTGSDGAVLNLSGGLDSAVVAYLAKKAKIDVRLLLLPENGVNDPKDVEDAVAVAKALNFKYSIIPINEAVEAVKRAFPESEFNSKNPTIAWANVKPRIRMLYAYLTANLERRIVLGTGNRTEILLGYATKYGDAGVDVLPIGSLYKTEVKILARHLKVPDSIIKKIPSAGLWKGQTDEGEIGVSYDVMDCVLHAIVDDGMSIEEAAANINVELPVVESLWRRMVQNAHKSTAAQVLGSRGQIGDNLKSSFNN